MKSVNWKWLFFKLRTTPLIIPVVLALFISSIANAETHSKPITKSITLAYEPVHNPPRALGRGTAINWEKPGLTLELLNIVGDRLGIEFIYKRLPWKRGLYLLKKNEIDGVFHASYKREREGYGVYPNKDGVVDVHRSIFYQSYVLYTRKGTVLKYNGDSTIRGRVGAISDYSIASELKSKGQEVEEAINQSANFNKLVKGQIVAFATLENMADDFIFRNSDKYTNIVKVHPALKSKAYYLLLSKGFVTQHPELSEEIWDTIADVKGSQEFKKIQGRY